jgi:radical SAM superfamily enzyme YgiQ (UPF0313 family)
MLPFPSLRLEITEVKNPVLRIHLVACSIEDSPLAYPLGALCIMAALRQNTTIAAQTQIQLTQYLADTHAPRAAAEEIASLEPDLVGVSVYLYNRVWFDEFITMLAIRLPKTRIFAGGAEVTANGATMLRNELSFLVIGEGEETLVRSIGQILAKEPVQGPGVISKEHPLRTLPTPPDLSKLPSPLLTGIADPSRYRGVLWEMTRGCPFHCSFCFESRGERTVRMYPFDRIEKELEVLARHAVEHVFVLDPTFNMDRERTIAILTLLRDKAPASMEFTFEVRAELIDETVAGLFSEVYCSLQIGLQSSDPKILSTVNRHFDPVLFKKKMDLLNSLGVVFGLDLIIGLPGDSLAKFEKSLAFAIAQKPSNLDIFPLALLPGTLLAEQADSYGLVYDHFSPYLIMESPTLSKDDLAKTMQLKEACDRFYTQGNAAMWFQSACDGVKMGSVEFLYAFHAFLAQHDPKGEADIFELQDRFVREIYHTRAKEALLPAILSYMELHQGLAFLQETGESPVVELYFVPESLVELDATSLEKFMRRHTTFKQPRSFVIYEDDGEYYFEEANN